MDDFAWLAIKEGVVALVGPLKTLIREVLRIYQLNISEMRYWYWQSAGASQRNLSVSASAGPGQHIRHRSAPKLPQDKPEIKPKILDHAKMLTIPLLFRL